MTIKPLLATKAEYDKIQYPVLASPKLDGIRCLMVEGVAMSRSMKPIPNKHVQQELKAFHGLDGELMIQGDYNEVQSAIMSRDGEPDFTYHVFDCFANHTETYEQRIQSIKDAEFDWHHRIEILEQRVICNESELDYYVSDCISRGYEGVMIRNSQAKYKFGRSDRDWETLHP